MKRIIICLFSVLLLLSLFGCSGSKAPDPQKELEENYDRHTFDDMVFYTPKGLELKVEEGDHYIILTDETHAYQISGFPSPEFDPVDFLEFSHPDFEIKTSEKGLPYVIDTEMVVVSSSRTNDAYFYIIYAAVYDENKDLIEADTVDFIEKIEVDPSVKVEAPETEETLNVRELTFTFPGSLRIEDHSDEIEQFAALYTSRDGNYAVYVEEITRADLEAAGYTEDTFRERVLKDAEDCSVSSSGKITYFAYEENGIFYLYGLVSGTESLYNVYQACQIENKDTYYPLMPEIFESLEVR